MKKTKKLLCVLLSLVMVFSCVSAFAFAEEKPFYVVLGDSIAYGSGLSNPVEACYGKIIADTFGFDYANHSVPGHTTDNLLQVISAEAAAEDLKKADIISISIGGNDFLTANLVGLMFEGIVKEDYSRFDEIAEKFYQNFCAIIDIINSYNAEAIILMQTMYNPQTATLRAPYQQAADRLNQQMAKYDAEHPGEIVLVDVATALGDDMKNYCADAIHPSVKGNENIAKVTAEKLFELGFAGAEELVITTKGKDSYIAAGASLFQIVGIFFTALRFMLKPFYMLLGYLPA